MQYAIHQCIGTLVGGCDFEILKLALKREVLAHKRSYNARWIFGGRGGAYHLKVAIGPGTSNYITSHYVPLNPSCRLFCTPIIYYSPLPSSNQTWQGKILDLEFVDSHCHLGDYRHGYWKSPSNGGSEFLASQLSGISPPIPAGGRKINGVMGKNHRKLGINQRKKGISPTMIVLVWWETGWNWLVFTAVF